MKTDIPLLQNVQVASPCPASWESMAIVDGDRVHFCQECQKRVYNLSAMSQAEAEGLLRTHEGRLCVRYYRRNDGTILTNDCSVGLQAARQLVFRKAKTSFALCLMFCAAFADYLSHQEQKPSVKKTNKSTPIYVIHEDPPGPRIGKVAERRKPEKNDVQQGWVWSEELQKKSGVDTEKSKPHPKDHK